jgi:dimethylargininase
MEVHDMRVEANEGATCDGGDVLYPVQWEGSAKLGGRHMFVGLSSRTNQQGFEYLCEVFHDLEVIPVRMTDISNVLHLKSITSHLDHLTLIMPTGRYGDELIQAMNAIEKGYTIVRVPDIKACNIISANGHVIAQKFISDESKEILEREVVSKRGMKLHYADTSEFSKCDGALTCKSILLS